MRYKIVDTYEGYEVLCETNDLNEAYNAMLQRVEDTDGECAVELIDRATRTF